MNEKVSIDDVIESSRNELARLAYSYSTIANHKAVWKKFQIYAKKCGVMTFTTEFAEDFLRDTYNYPQAYSIGIPMPKKTIRKIRSIRILQDFYSLGVLPRKLLPPPTECPEAFNVVYKKYREYCTADG